MLAVSSIATTALMRAPIAPKMQASPSLTPATSEWVNSLPGVTAPFGVFDPAGLAPETQEEFMLFREAELAHGRVAMMAALGFLVQESFHPIFDETVIGAGPVIHQLDKVLEFETGQFFGSCLLMAIFFSEIARARIGWVEPEVEMRTLREGYLPGDLQFDPLGLKPTEPASLLAMQNKEINNGRLAMLAVAGMTAQELVTDKTLF